MRRNRRAPSNEKPFDPGLEVKDYEELRLERAFSFKKEYERAHKVAPVMSCTGFIMAIVGGNVFHHVVKGNGRWNVEGQSVDFRRMLKRDVGALGKIIKLKEAKECRVVQLFLTGADAAIIKKYKRKTVEFQ